MWRRSLGETRASGWKSRTSPASWLGPNWDASKRVTRPTPERPATRACQEDGASLPTGETAPMPVTTTRGAIAESVRGVNRRGYGLSSLLARGGRKGPCVAAGSVPAELGCHAYVEVGAVLEAEEASLVVALLHGDGIALAQLQVNLAIEAEHGLLPGLQGDVHRLRAGQDDSVLGSEVRRDGHDDEIARLRVEDGPVEGEGVGGAAGGGCDDDAVAAVVGDAHAIDIHGKLDGAAEGGAADDGFVEGVVVLSSGADAGLEHGARLDAAAAVE